VKNIENLSYNIGTKELKSLSNVLNDAKIINSEEISEVYEHIGNYFERLENYEKALVTFAVNKDFFDKDNISRIGWSKIVMKKVDNKHKKNLEILIEKCNLKSAVEKFKKIKIENGNKKYFLESLNKVINDLYACGLNNGKVEELSKVIIKIQKYRNNKFKRIYDEYADNNRCWSCMPEIKKIAYGKNITYNSFIDRLKFLRSRIPKYIGFTWNDLDELRAIHRYFLENKEINEMEKKNPKLKKECDKTLQHLKKIITIREKTLIPSI